MKKILLVIISAISLSLNVIAQQWLPINGHSGTIYSFIEISEGTLVGTSCGIFITKDEGATYKEYSIGMPSGNIRYISKLNNTYFCIIEDKGICSSSDNGVHWTYSRKGRFYQNIQTSDKEIFVQSLFKDTLFYSNDEGKTWRDLHINNNSQSLIYTSANKLFRYQYASTPKGLYESLDAGKTWSLNSNGFNGYSPIITELDGKTYALNQHVHQLNSNGIGWTKVTSDTLTWTNNQFGKILFSPEYFTILDGTIYARTGGTVALKLAKWKPSENSWSSFDNGLNYDANLVSILTCLFSTGKKIVLSQNDTLLQTSAINNWLVQTTVGLNSNPILAFSTQNNKISCYSKFPIDRNKLTSPTRLFEASQTDLNWTYTKKAGFIISNPTNEALLYFIGDTILSAYDLKLRYYKQSDKTEKQLTLLDIIDVPKVFEFNDSLYFYGATGINGSTLPQVICYSKDFKFSENRRLGAGFDLGNYKKMVSIITHKNTMFELSSSDDGTISEVSKYQRTDATTFWKQVTSRINGQKFAANAIGDWKGRLYIGLKNGAGVMYSEDEGKTWISDNAGLVNCTPTCFYNLGDTLLMGSEAGMYAQISGSSNWINLTRNLPVGTIKKIDITSGLIIVQLDGGNLWTIYRNGLTLGYDNKLIEQYAIYPNPTNSHYITIQSPVAHQYIIVDYLGNQLQLGTLHEGSNIIALPNNMCNGMYFIQIGNTTQKIIINQ